MTTAWEKLAENKQATQHRSIISLFEDEARVEKFSAHAGEILLDFSKTNIDCDALSRLLRLARDSGVESRRDAMLSGEKINLTEGRAVLHTALRSSSKTPLVVDGQDVRASVAQTLNKMKSFCRGVRDGQIVSPSGEKFTDVVNIGIGGSDLGPAMATLALAPYCDGPKCHFVSNIDGAHIHDVLKNLNPKSTLVVIASKTFSTVETMTNSRAALVWLKRGVGAECVGHLAAVSSATDRTSAMGIDPDRVFGFGDWVGGRYSLWGPIGLSVMMAIGPEDFMHFLAGAEMMDVHFQNTPLPRNLPVLLALVGIWHRNISGHPTRAVLPYDQRLARFPAYLQQLDMESNGKSVSIDGNTLTRAAGPVVWGEPGTNGQHAFFQLLHQGCDVIPAEFLIAKEGHEAELCEHHDLLKANCLAQSEALMVGRTLAEARTVAADLGYSGDELERQAAHRVFPGNRPSVTIAYQKLTPFTLGALIALYEHRVFVEGVIWNINSFDQWGVELGKELASSLVPMVRSGNADGKDASTKAMITYLKS